MVSAEACAAGYSKIHGTCAQCGQGTAKSEPGDHACTPCPGGTFGNARGLTQCTGCPMDTIADGPGQRRCEPCQAGFTSNAERTECRKFVSVFELFTGFRVSYRQNQTNLRGLPFLLFDASERPQKINPCGGDRELISDNKPKRWSLTATPQISCFPILSSYVI